MHNYKKTTSICQHCKVTNCSWMLDLKPVANWTAIPTTIKYADKTIKSANVRSCPQYQKGTK